MNPNFTPRAQQVLKLARNEADRLNHNFVGPEHLLLGLMGLGNGVAVNVLAHLGLNLDNLRQEVEKQMGKGNEPKVVGNIPYASPLKKVLALALKYANGLSHSYVGTEHLLLGMLEDGDGATRVLVKLGVNPEQTRLEILKELGASSIFSLPKTSPTLIEEPSVNYSPHAQKILALARNEAVRCHHFFVGTEHLLLGLTAVDQGVAAIVLRKFGLNPAAVRSEIEKQVGTGPDLKSVGPASSTPRVIKILALAKKEATNLQHTYVGTQHLLLGMLIEGEGVAARILMQFGINIEQTRSEILKEMERNPDDH